MRGYTVPGDIPASFPCQPYIDLRSPWIDWCWIYFTSIKLNIRLMFTFLFFRHDISRAENKLEMYMMSHFTAEVPWKVGKNQNYLDSLRPTGSQKCKAFLMEKWSWEIRFHLLVLKAAVFESLYFIVHWSGAITIFSIELREKESGRRPSCGLGLQGGGGGQR